MQHRFIRTSNDRMGRVEDIDSFGNIVSTEYPVIAEKTDSQGFTLKTYSGFSKYIRAINIDKANSNPVITSTSIDDLIVEINNNFFFEIDTEAILDKVTWQLAYNNSSSPKVLDLSENTFFGLNGKKLFVSGTWEFAPTVNVSRNRFIVAPNSGSKVADFRDDFNNILLEIDRDYLSIAQNISALDSSKDTLVLKRNLFQKTNLLTIKGELDDDLFSIDENLFLENTNDIKVERTGSASGFYFNRTDGASGSLIAGSIAVAVRYDETGSFLFQTQSKSNINDRNGVGVQTQVSISNTGDVEIHDSNSGVILTSSDGSKYRLKVDNSGNLTTEIA
jgi:hypothetical protein